MQLTTATPASSAFHVEFGRFLRTDGQEVEQHFGARFLERGNDAGLVASGASATMNPRSPARSCDRQPRRGCDP
jgi:hypothetical protein